MAFPFIFHENFEAGTKGGFDTETDEDGRLDFPDHNDGLEIPPWRGGYVMRADLNRGFAKPAYVGQNTVLNTMTTGDTRFIRFMLRVSSDFRMPPGNSMQIFSVFKGPIVVPPLIPAPTDLEFGIGITRTEAHINSSRMSIYAPDYSEFIDGLNFPVGRWFSVQITIFHSTNVSRVYLHVGDNTLQVMRLDFAPFTGFYMGALAQAPDVRGTLYFDDIIIDEEKLEDPNYIDPANLSGETLVFFKTSYAFVGPGVIRGATLISGGSTSTALFYDAERLPLAHHDIKGGLKCSSAESKDSLIDGIEFKRGCYIVMTGTNPQVIVHCGQVGPEQAQGEEGSVLEEVPGMPIRSGVGLA